MSKSGQRRVYVIELKDSVGPRTDPRFPNVYVGETGWSVSRRIKRHRAGGLYSASVVEKHFLRRRADLYRDEPTTADRKQSERNERALAERLHDAGYRVYTNGGWLKALPATGTRGCS
jgi:hypothetical protein